AGLPLVMADRISVTTGEGRAQEYIARYERPAERSLNQQAVLERLNGLGFEAAPRLVAMAADLSIEEAFPGLPWLAIRPQYPAADAVIADLARLHSLDVREGLDWHREPKDLLPKPEPP